MTRIVVIPASQSLLFPLALLLLLGTLASPALAGGGSGARQQTPEETQGLRIVTGLPPEGMISTQSDGESYMEGETGRSGVFFLPLPANLPPEQRKAALAVIEEAEPKLTALHQQMSSTLMELHNLSFAEDTPPEQLTTLGRKLVTTRNAILLELKALCGKLERNAGFNPGWGSQRTCTFRHQRDCEHQQHSYSSAQ